MTMQDILAQVAAGKINAADAGKLIEGMTPKGNGGGWKTQVHVSRNKSGGVFVRHPKFVERSEAKGKDYIAGINIPPNVAKVLFGDSAVFAELAKLVLALPDGKGVDQPAMAAS